MIFADENLSIIGQSLVVFESRIPELPSGSPSRAALTIIGGRSSEIYVENISLIHMTAIDERRGTTRGVLLRGLGGATLRRVRVRSFSDYSIRLEDVLEGEVEECTSTRNRFAGLSRPPN